MHQTLARGKQTKLKNYCSNSEEPAFEVLCVYNDYMWRNPRSSREKASVTVAGHSGPIGLKKALPLYSGLGVARIKISKQKP